MPSITLTATQAQVDRLLAALPPDYTADLAGAKTFLIDCAKERIRAKEQADLNAAVNAGVPPVVTIT